MVDIFTMLMNQISLCRKSIRIYHQEQNSSLRRKLNLWTNSVEGNNSECFPTLSDI